MSRGSGESPIQIPFNCLPAEAAQTDGIPAGFAVQSIGGVSVFLSGATVSSAQVIDETKTSFAVVAAYTESTEDTVPASAGDPVGLDGWVRQIPTIDEIYATGFDHDLLRARLMGCFLMWKHWPIARKRSLSIQNVDQSPMEAGIADTNGGSGYQGQRGGEGSGEVVLSIYELHLRNIQYSLDLSIVRNGDYVYVLDDEPPDEGRFLQIEYFHGTYVDDEPVAKMRDDVQTNVKACDMFSVGFIATLMQAWFKQTESGNALVIASA